MKQVLKTVTKPLATVILFLSLSLTSFSQTSRFGISINSLTTNFNYGKSNKELQSYKKKFTGLQIGFAYQAGISPMFSLVPELYFAIKGGVLKESNPMTTNKLTLRIYSIEMPVLARFHFNKLYLNAGPYTAYALGGRMKTEGSETAPATSTKISFGNAANAFRRWDAGVQAGAGYNFNLKRSVLTLDVRYGYGLVNISRDIERYNRMLNISLVLSKTGKRVTKEKQG